MDMPAALRRLLAYANVFVSILQAAYATHSMYGTAVLAFARRFRHTLQYGHTRATTPSCSAANMDLGPRRRLERYHCNDKCTPALTGRPVTALSSVVRFS
jgi:hypothetical protein